MTSPTVQTTTTPILDRLEPLPPLRSWQHKRLRGTAPILVGLVLGFLLGFSGIRSTLTPLGALIEPLADAIRDVGILEFFLVTAITLFPAIAVHEAGHAIGGWLAGFDVHSIRVWRLELHLPFRLAFFRGSGGGAGGWVICTPRTTKDLAARAGVMLVAGPAANLASWMLIYALPGEHGLFVRSFMFWSFLLGSTNLVPMRTGALFSDGYRLLMLLFDRPRGERWLALLKLSKDVLDGIDPKNLSEEFLGVATAVKDESSDTVSAHALAYSSAFRRRQDDEAARHLETCLRSSARTSKGMQQALMADAAVFQGRRRGNADLAQAWLDGMPAKVEVPWHRLWAEAGVLEARGDRDGVLAKLDEIERQIRARAHPFQRFSLASLERWRADLAAQ